jgi:anti-sigma factor RsiW
VGAFKAGCDRAREWTSLALDGELSELEDALLEQHLGRCSACAEYADTVRAATGELRAAPPLPAAVEVAVPRVKRGVVRRTLVPVAAVLAVVAGTLGTTSVAQAPSSQTSKPPYFEKRLLTLARHTHSEIDIGS